MRKERVSSNIYLHMNEMRFSFQFCVDGKWHTWIDYEKFHELVKRYEDSNGTETFTGIRVFAKHFFFSFWRHLQLVFIKH